MKKMNKILSLVLSLIMISSTMAVPAFAADKEDADIAIGSLYPDVKTTEAYYGDLELLSALDIFVGDDKGNFNPNDTITRAEATAVITRMLGYNFAAGKSKTDYADVPETHWASGAIATGTSLGIIVGYGDGNFGPEDPVKYEEILTMIVRGLGYDPMVNTLKGNWPYNYITVANQIGIKSNVSGYNTGDEAPRKLVASFIASALDTPIMKQVSYGSQMEFAPMDGSNYRAYETTLSEQFDSYKVRGLVVATDKSSIDGSSKTQAGYAKIKLYDAYNYVVLEEYIEDEELLMVYDNGKLRNAVGSPIIAYITEDDNRSSDYSLLSYSIDNRKYDSIIIDNVDNIDLSDNAKATRNFGSESNSKPVLVVWDDDTDKRKSYYIDENASILLNDNFYANVKDDIVTNDIFNIEYGTVTLKDNDNDSNYDIVQIDVYVTMVIDEITEKYKKITDLNNYQSALRFDDYYIDEEDLAYKFVLDGKEIDFKDLKQYDVLSIKANVMENGKVDVQEADNYYIIVTRDKIEGMVKSIGYDKNVPYYDINGNDYETVPGLMEELSLTDEGTFYLDAFGRIAYYDVNISSSHNYAYIYKVGATSEAFDDYVEMKMVFKNGTSDILQTPVKGFSIYDSNGEQNRVHVGSTTSSYESFFGEGWDEKIEGQMVTYDTNSNGEVTKIYLPQSRDDSAKTFSLDKSLSEARYKESTETLGNVTVTKNTVVFFIPRSVDSISDITVGTINTLEDDEYYDVDIYDLDNDLNARLVVVKSETNTVQLKKNIYLVTDVSMALNEDDDVVQKIKVFYQGQAKTLYVDPDDGEYDVEEGDIIAINLNADGYINKLVKMLDISNAEVYNLRDFTVSGSSVDDVQTAVGYVTSKKKNTLSISTDPDREGELLYGSGAYVYKVEGSRKDAEIAEWEDVETYNNNEDAFVFIRTYDENVTDIVIYENVFRTSSSHGSNSYSYTASIANKNIAFSTTVEELKTLISIKKSRNGLEDSSFVVDESKITLEGFTPNTVGEQTITVKYNNTAAGNIKVNVLDAVVTYTAEITEEAYASSVTIDEIKSDIVIEKYIDGTKDDSFVLDITKLTLSTIDLTNYTNQTVTVTYDNAEVGQITVKINEPVIEYEYTLSNVSFPYATTAEEVKSNFSVKKYVNEVEDNTFVFDASLLTVNGYTEKLEGEQTLEVSYDGVALESTEVTTISPIRTYTATITSTNVIRNTSINDVKNTINITESLDGVINEEFVQDNSKLTIEGLNLSVAGQYATLIKYNGNNALVTIITVKPIASTLSTDIASKTFTVGTPVEFTFTTVANDDAGKTVVGTSNFSNADAIEKLEYYEVATSTWHDLNGAFGGGAGFPMSDSTSKFRVTFKTAGNYSFTANMKLLEGGNVLCSTNVDFTVSE